MNELGLEIITILKMLKVKGDMILSVLFIKVIS